MIRLAYRVLSVFSLFRAASKGPGAMLRKRAERARRFLRAMTAHPPHGTPTGGQWITPGVVDAVGLALWRVMQQGFDRIDHDIKHLGDRLDRHLEGHAK